MKPRTKLQKQIVELSKKLPPLTEAQKKYAGTLFETFGYYWKKGEVWCQCCGHIDIVMQPMLAVSIGVGSHTCPNCGKVLNLKHWNQSIRKSLSEALDYSVAQPFKGYMVVRTFRVQRDNIKGFDTHLLMYETFQNWIAEDGKEMILGKKYTRSPFHFSWDYTSEMDVKFHNHSATGYYEMKDVFDVSGNYLYPRVSVTSRLKRNGWTNKLLKLKRISIVDAMKQLLNNPIAETVVKTGQLKVFEYMLRKGNYTITHQHALNICNRNGYIVKDASMWFDYLGLLDYFRLDTHNPHYVCPADLKAEHDRLLRKKQRVEARRKEEEKRRQIADWEKVYKKEKGKFFGICFGDGNIAISVIQSVAEIAEEGEAMHHCVFSAEYYKRPDSLILSAKDSAGNRLETVEVSLSTFKVVQSRAVCNKTTPYHNRIINLVEKNIGLIRKKLTA